MGWLELFYDLVFVVVIAELADFLARHVTASGVLGYVLLFIPVWWVWIGGTIYTERFETEDVSFRVFTFLQMLPIAAMALFVHNGLGAGGQGFALSYTAARLVLIFMWLRGGWYVPAMRPVTSRYSVGFTVSVLLFLLSVFVDPPLRFVLWGVGLAIDLLTPLPTLRFQARLPRFSTSRLPERFGLFVIIVLGEAIVGVVQGLAKQQRLSAGVIAGGVFGMALAFGLWWTYFDFVAHRHPKSGVWWTLAFSYAHLPLVMAIAAVGAGVLNLLTLEQGVLSANVRWLITGAAAVALSAIGLIELLLQRTGEDPVNPRVSFPLKVAAGTLALGLGLGGGTLGPLTLLSMLILLVLAQMLYAALTWFRSAPA
ncbi:MAG TPA: low temperature requirement protein A [bacterium]|nr:low temperature requirement protein A [bacterium]